MPEITPAASSSKGAAEEAAATEFDAAAEGSPVSMNPDCAMEMENPECSLEMENPDCSFPEDDGNPTCEMPEGEQPEDENPAFEAKDEVLVVQDNEDELRMPSLKLVSLLCLVGGLEGADNVLLPCVFYALQQDLGLTLNDLAMMSMVQALAGQFASPLWGVMADRGVLRRKTIIVVGCVIQGLITCVLAGVDNMVPMLLLRAFNGAMLASLRPIANGIIADVTSESHRGRVYGSMGIAMNVGTMAGTLVGTNLARNTVAGLQGWRVSFLIIGLASVLVGAITWLAMSEPPKLAVAESKGQGFGAFKAEVWELASYFRMPSFCVLIIQGCFGTVPWNALGYKTLFFQLGGITDLQASLIDVFSQIAGSLGGLLGGVIGDNMSRCSRNHGRPITAQISVLAGIPVAWFIFMAQPPADGAFAYYLALMVTLGLTATWCGVGVNLPILSEIVRDDRRATIMAWEGTLENSCSAIFGNAMVGFLAQNVFGYDLSKARTSTASSDPSNTKALGSALMLVSFFPWVLCFVSYTLLHWSYPRDLRWLAAQERARQEKQRQDSKELGGQTATSQSTEGEGEVSEVVIVVSGEPADQDERSPCGKDCPARPRLSAAAAQAVHP